MRRKRKKFSRISGRWLTRGEERLLATIRYSAYDQRRRRATRVRGRRKRLPPRHEVPSEIMVIPGLAERFKSLKRAREKEIEAMRDK